MGFTRFRAWGPGLLGFGAQGQQDNGEAMNTHDKHITKTRLVTETRFKHAAMRMCRPVNMQANQPKALHIHESF